MKIYNYGNDYVFQHTKKSPTKVDNNPEANATDKIQGGREREFGEDETIQSPQQEQHTKVKKKKAQAGS